MQQDVSFKIPCRIKVQELLSSRYEDGKRPLNWDKRKAGIDTVRTADGLVLKLESDGGQSPPQKDWTLLLSRGDAENGYIWTLYGM
jgi:hypothetical protein